MLQLLLPPLRAHGTRDPGQASQHPNEQHRLQQIKSRRDLAGFSQRGQEVFCVNSELGNFNASQGVFPPMRMTEDDFGMTLKECFHTGRYDSLAGRTKLLRNFFN